jgi:hypothetical protein
VGLDNDGDGNYDGNDSECGGSSPSPGEVSGNLATPLLVTAKNVGAGQITIAYDPLTCETADNSLVYGAFPVVGYPYTGAVCSIGNTGGYVWAYDPGSVFFLIVGNDGATIEGSYGTSDGVTERPQDTTCGLTQDLPNRCD